MSGKTAVLQQIIEFYDETITLLGKENLYSEFQKEIQNSISDIIQSIAPNSRIAIRGAGLHTAVLFEMFDFSHLEVIGLIDKVKTADTYVGYPIYLTDELPKLHCDAVIISSYSYRKEMCKEYENSEIEVIDLYAKLKNKFGELNAPFYEYIPTFYESTQTIVNYFYMKYAKNQNQESRFQDLMHLIKLALEVKDFVLFDYLYKENIHLFEQNSILQEIYHRITVLLEMIRSAVSARKQKDVFWFWTDAVSYDRMHMPKLQSLFNKGLFFERAYTSTPYTFPTMLLLFRQMYAIDDYSERYENISAENSTVIRFLQNKGYSFKCIGSECAYFSDRREIKVYASCNLIFWETLCELLSEEKPGFYLLQFCTETHPPTVVPNLLSRSDEIAIYQDDTQVQTAHQYVDDCLELYRSLLMGKTQIYMSDHGDFFDPYALFWSEHKLHTYFLVYGNNIPTARIKELFPYERFEKLVQWIVESENCPLSDVCAKIATFQDMDLCTGALIRRYINLGVAKKIFSYRGALNNRYKYVLNSLGEEFFYYIEDNTEKQVNSIPEKEKKELKEAAGCMFLDINKYKQFSESKEAYKLLGVSRLN